MADRPLRPATDRRLGEPLPHQLPNPPQAPLQARGQTIPRFNNCHHVVPLHYAVLAAVSDCYSPPKGRLPTCYSPVRHSTVHPKANSSVRLACLRHAASVDSEPGSNSRLEVLILEHNRYWIVSDYDSSRVLAASFIARRLLSKVFSRTRSI